MDNVKGVLLLLVLLLGSATFVFFLQASTAKGQVSEALVLSSVTRDMLRAQGTRCSAAPEQFQKIAECVAPLLRANDFKQDTFKQPDDRRGTTGYIVVKNVNRRTYDAGEFTFYKNRELIQTGCNVPGEIGPDVTCRFDFPGECNDGDILEIFYPINEEPTKVFLKTC